MNKAWFERKKVELDIANTPILEWPSPIMRQQVIMAQIFNDQQFNQMQANVALDQSYLAMQNQGLQNSYHPDAYQMEYESRGLPCGCIACAELRMDAEVKAYEASQKKQEIKEDPKPIGKITLILNKDI